MSIYNIDLGKPKSGARAFIIIIIIIIMIIMMMIMVMMMKIICFIHTGAQ